MKLKLLVGVFLGSFLVSTAQTDTITSSVIMEDVTVKAFRHYQNVTQLADIHGTYLTAGHKNEVISIASLPANIAEKTGRQIFARIPGAFVYDMDGSGNQINFATRSLDPHRSWEFNVRQNGVVINSDIYGYPASHYSMPMEAVKTVEVIRGTSALQYGAEFGGMVNYVLKGPDTSKVLGLESVGSVGSFGLQSLFNSAGGRHGKWTYYGYMYNRASDDYRKNGESRANAQYFCLGYDLSKKMSLKFELGRSTYIYRLPGPLTDVQFEADPRQATRSRNYYSPEIFVPSLHWNWKLGPQTTVNWIFSGVFGSRNSVLFEGFATRQDTVNRSTGLYESRIVDIDQFNSKTSELRLVHQYRTGRLRHVITGGIRYFNNDMRRRQRGKGTSGSDYDLTIEGVFGRDMDYKSNSLAFSLENMVYLTDRITLTPGMRYELGQTDMTGYISYLDPEDIPNRIRHRIPALGINSRWEITRRLQLYGGISQAYRPVLFKDIIPGSVLEVANKDLKNAFGYNAELGFRGSHGWITRFDITLFALRYNHRLGNLVRQTPEGTSYIYKTNIGDSQSSGIEWYTEVSPVKTDNLTVSAFTATSWMKARYVNAVVAINGENRDISGNHIESAPEWISRNGLGISYRALSTVLQYSYVSESYADPANTVIPAIDGSVGLVPAYGIWDFNATYFVGSNWKARISLNNLADRQYFTKRPLFYPGPGIWPSAGRSFVVSIGVSL